ncbi:hypothetical protein GO755_27560 [Spirosoma sp. HMF4905]|uniref:Uncharacterized protein n=1 Tax=Spirosoma arboris TaxID=2682092 RepID=A0A7K1SJR8_9BACT|nr:hypothetical protein [Spirosoma arboris]MVM33826.1 hypothetical protein [Spirosoma arboris]
MTNPPLSRIERLQLQARQIQQFTPHSSPILVAESFAEFRRLLLEVVEPSPLLAPVTEQDWARITHYTMASTLIEIRAKPDLAAFLGGEGSALADLQAKVAQSIKLLA